MERGTWLEGLENQKEDDRLMDFRSAIEAVMKKRCPRDKVTDITGKVITSRPWVYVDSRVDEHCYEVAFYCPTGYSAQDLMQETDSIAAACGHPVEITDRFGAVVVKVVFHDFPDEIPFHAGMLKMTKGRDLLLGFDLQGKPVTHSLKIPHIAIGGQSGYGKTDLLRFLVLQLISRFTPDELWIDIIDGKGFSFLPFKKIPHIRRIARDLAGAYSLMREARETMTARSNMVWEDDDREGASGFQFRLIIVDELAVISPALQVTKDNKKIAEATYAEMALISGTGREAQVGLLLATQRPDANVLSPLVKANCDASIALKCKTLSNSQIILDQGGAEKLPHKKPGRAIYSSTTDTIFQIPFVGVDAKWHKVLAPYVKEGHSIEYNEESAHFIDVDELPDHLD
jgi:hypothetical protein